MSTEDIAKEVLEELNSAESKFAPFNSSHEGYAVLLEEVDELWDVVKLNPKKISNPGWLMAARDEDHYFKLQIDERKRMMRAEAIQVAAMAIRFIKCVCDD